MSIAYNDTIITGSKTLGAGTYGEDEILLPPMPKGTLPGILRIEIEDTNGAATTLNAADDYLRMHLSPKSQDDVLDISDPDAMCCINLEAAGVSVATRDKIAHYDFPAPLLVSYNKIYIGLKSTFAQTIKYRIHMVGRASRVPQKDNLVSQLQF